MGTLRCPRRLAQHHSPAAGGPAITRLESALAGARLYLVDGLISDAGRQVAEAVAQQGLFDASTLKEPYRIEGKKTMGFEIAEQLGWTLPDVILYPTGGGVGLIGIYKALRELQELGWVQGPLPRLVAVQASGCAPIVQAWQQGERESRFWPDSQTLAFGINVPKALGIFWCWTPSIAPRAAPSRWKMAPSSASCVNSPPRRAASSARKAAASPPPASCGKRAGSGRAGGGAQHRRRHQVPGRHHGRAPAAAPRREDPGMSFDWSFVLTTLPAFGQSVWVTLQLGAIVILTSLTVALLNVTLQSLHKPWLNGVIRAYVELARNTPLLIQLFFLYFGLPALGLSLSGFATAVIAMTFLGGGYLTEALRAGVQAVPTSQLEAGRAIGLSRWQLLRHVQLPQAWLASLPALFANFIFLLKETTVASAVAVPELLYTTKNYIALYYKTYEMLAVLTLMCVLIFLPLSLALRVVERRLQHGQFGH